jgi:hypothetical protein
MESLDPELSTEEDPGNLKDDESSGSSLLQNDLASLDSMESLDPELSTEEDPGNLKDDESSGSSLLQNDLASFQGKFFSFECYVSLTLAPQIGDFNCGLQRLEYGQSIYICAGFL